MPRFEIIRSDKENPTNFTRENIADFFYDHLDEFGDKKEYILNCIGYAYGDNPGQDGFILLAIDESNEEPKITGGVIINRTNMSGYIPENILVYIAVHGDYRGEGLGSQLMERIIEAADGDIALHVEPDNPAVHLYEKYNFTNKYLEMRLAK